MKKTFSAFALLFVFASTIAFSQTTAHSKPVQMTAIIPEYIGLTAVNSLPVKFDFKGQQDHISEGYHNLTVQSLTAPTWKLNYNLKSRTVTVVAYASDLKGNVSDVIPAANIAGQSLQNNTNWQWFDSYAGTMGKHAMLLDTFKTTKGNGSSLNSTNGKDKMEGFSVLNVNIVPGGLNGPVPTPDTYHGFLYIVAQAL